MTMTTTRYIAVVLGLLFYSYSFSAFGHGGKGHGKGTSGHGKSCNSSASGKSSSFGQALRNAMQNPMDDLRRAEVQKAYRELNSSMKEFNAAAKKGDISPQDLPKFQHGLAKALNDSANETNPLPLKVEAAQSRTEAPRPGGEEPAPRPFAAEPQPSSEIVRITDVPEVIVVSVPPNREPTSQTENNSESNAPLRGAEAPSTATTPGAVGEVHFPAATKFQQLGDLLQRPRDSENTTSRELASSSQKPGRGTDSEESSAASSATSGNEGEEGETLVASNEEPLPLEAPKAKESQPLVLVSGVSEDSSGAVSLKKKTDLTSLTTPAAAEATPRQFASPKSFASFDRGLLAFLSVFTFLSLASMVAYLRVRARWKC